MFAVLLVSRTLPVVAFCDLLILVGVMLLGLSLSASWVWTQRQTLARFLVALCLALLVAGVVMSARGLSDTPIYVPYCDGMWGYIDPMCWKVY